MRIPSVRGLIDRRILANYRITPEVMAKILPAPFRPIIVKGYSIGGICLIRLKNIRPRLFPFPWGINSENTAHRIAVEWDVGGQTQEGVYIPRRDTSSLINSFVGGRIFPGVHHHATFKTDESPDYYSVTMESDDGKAHVQVSGNITNNLSSQSVFSSVESVSDFFERGSLGYSDTKKEGLYDGIELQCKNWQVSALEVEKIESSYFEDESLFPKGSVEFDCALLMRDIEHEWHSKEDICCVNPIVA